MAEPASQTSTEAAPSRVEARPVKDPAVRSFILAAMLLGFSLWCVLDLRRPPAAWDVKHVNEVFSYLLNNFGPFLFVSLGVLFLIRGMLMLARTLVADEQGIGFAEKDRIPWETITAVDATVLRAKGILRISAGEQTRLKLCDWHWRREQFRAVVASIERHVPADRIRR